MSCGENLYAKHSVEYDNLKSYFYCFSIWDETNHCISWEDTKEFCQLLGIEHVPILHNSFTWDKNGTPYWLSDLFPIHLDITQQEGYVVRNADKFHYDDFSTNVAKWVRQNHVLPNSTHWMHTQIIPNKLIKH